jgi:hypothetical protein
MSGPAAVLYGLIDLVPTAPVAVAVEARTAPAPEA